MTTPFDPIPVADDLCEILHRPDWRERRPELDVLVRSAGGALAGVLGELDRRGLLDPLVPDEPSEEGARLFGDLIAGAGGEPGLLLLAMVPIRRGGAYASGQLDLLIQKAQEGGSLPALFSALIQGGHYEQMLAVLTYGGLAESPALRALAESRPSYGQDALNAPTVSAIRAHHAAGGPGSGGAAYDVLIIPGFTPCDAAQPMAIAEIPVACQRLALAAQDFRDGRAPFLIVSGGSVHPPGTCCNEALMMREHLLQLGVPAERILVEPYARHTPTNLRNAGRMMLENGLPRGLIVTGFDRPVFSQSFYLAYPVLSTFAARSVEDLGYSVGSLDGVDEHHIAFVPDGAVSTRKYLDPLDA